MGWIAVALGVAALVTAVLVGVHAARQRRRQADRLAAAIAALQERLDTTQARQALAVVERQLRGEPVPELPEPPPGTRRRGHLWLVPGIAAGGVIGWVWKHKAPATATTVVLGALLLGSPSGEPELPEAAPAPPVPAPAPEPTSGATPPSPGSGPDSAGPSLAPSPTQQPVVLPVPPSVPVPEPAPGAPSPTPLAPTTPPPSPSPSPQQPGDDRGSLLCVRLELLGVELQLCLP